MISLPFHFPRRVIRRREADGATATGLPRRLPHYSFFVLVAGFALFLRLNAAHGSLWLDEVWSLELAQQAPSWSSVVTDLRCDNNHPLNTLYLRAVGSGRSPLVYRLPAVVAGTALVVGGGWTAARWGRVASLTAATLLASSYLLVHYSSEARGYSLALCAAFCGWESALRYLESRRGTAALAFWISGLVGLLAHPIFVHFLLAAACWLVPALASRTVDPWGRARSAAILLAVPLAGTAASYWLLWRNLELGGGPPCEPWQVISQTFSLAIGGPPTGWGSWLAAAVAGAAGIWACWRLRFDLYQAGLFLAMTQLVPVTHALAARPPFLFPRYFLMAAGFVPLLVAFALARLYRIRRWGRWIYAGLLLGWIGGNLILFVPLSTVGRGQYLAALDYIARSTGESPITVSSDHNFGVRRLIEFYAPQLPTRPPFQYINGDQWPPAGPRWLILHRYAESELPPPAERQVIDGHSFQLDQTFDCSILSGWQWWCYRRLP